MTQLGQELRGVAPVDVERLPFGFDDFVGGVLGAERSIAELAGSAAAWIGELDRQEWQMELDKQTRRLCVDRLLAKDRLRGLAAEPLGDRMTDKASVLAQIYLGDIAAGAMSLSTAVVEGVRSAHRIPRQSRGEDDRPRVPTSVLGPIIPVEAYESPRYTAHLRTPEGMPFKAIMHTRDGVPLPTQYMVVVPGGMCLAWWQGARSPDGFNFYDSQGRSDRQNFPGATLLLSLLQDARVVPYAEYEEARVDRFRRISEHANRVAASTPNRKQSQNAPGPRNAMVIWERRPLRIRS